jgi:hypothetical protein
LIRWSFLFTDSSYSKHHETFPVFFRKQLMCGVGLSTPRTKKSIGFPSFSPSIIVCVRMVRRKFSGFLSTQHCPDQRSTEMGNNITNQFSIRH